jgi:uncharacterized protein (TIGR03083 family)
MQYEDRLEAVASEGDALVAAAAGNLDRTVPSCPEWDVAALVRHQGGVYSWVSAVLAAGGERPTTPRQSGPEGHDGLVAWFDEVRSKMLADLGRHHPDDPAWVFMPTSARNVGWWARRQALETAVHRVDAELAGGEAEPVAADLAVDGLDEFLMEFLPGLLAQRPVEGLHGTLHLHATDADGEWMIDLDGHEPARREHGKADTAVRGPASGLYLWAFNRQTPEEAGLEVFGNPSLVEAWKGVKL